MDIVEDVEYIGSMRNTMLVEKEDRIRKKAGMKTLQLPDDEAEKFRKICYEKTWELVIGNAPEYGPKLKQLSSKKALPKGAFLWMD